MKPSEVIREARSQLFGKGWTTLVLENDRGEMCIEGACSRALQCERPVFLNHLALHNETAAALLPILASAIRQVSEVDGFDGEIVWRFNDTYERTFDEVIDMLDKAEKLAEISEQAQT